MITFFAPVPPEAVGLSVVTFLIGLIFGRAKTKPLRAFWVGTEDVYAARSEEQALKLATEDGTKFLTLDDVQEITGASLWHQIPEESGPARSLIELLSKARRPGWIACARG
jgi:hypothetical protein